MTSWQDQQGRGGRSGAALDPSRPAGVPSEGQPLSRREARERERRMAEASGAAPAHPSGVVDFTQHDYGSDYPTDQDFNVGDTTDIWAALSRRSERQEPQRPEQADLNRFSTGVPESVAPPAPAPSGSSVSGELLDRVRGAVLRPRDAEQAVPPTVVAPVRQDAFHAQPGLTRRELRAFHDDRADEPETHWSPQAAASPAAPVESEAAYGDAVYEDYDDEYYDEEYRPDPTIAIRAVPDAAAAPRPASAPVDLPQYFTEPAGDDALRFSSAATHQEAEPRSEHPRSQADAAFVEPSAWSAPSRAAAYQDAEYDVAPAPDAFQNPQLGPPSEVTDLAGFEALIRQARSRTPEAPAPAPQPKAAQSKPLAWADDEDASEGFTGLLSRQIQGSHGSPNALILPEDAPVDLTQAVSPSGDPFITGSLNLSRSLSTTGAHSEHFEAADIDRLYDASQDEPAAGVAPVRATRAVAGTGPSRAIPGARRARGNVLPTVLAIIAGAMAVGVVTLLVGSWVLKLF